MGKVLIIKNADFSLNSIDNVSPRQDWGKGDIYSLDKVFNGREAVNSGVNLLDGSHTQWVLAVDGNEATNAATVEADYLGIVVRISSIVSPDTDNWLLYSFKPTVTGIVFANKGKNPNFSRQASKILIKRNGNDFYFSADGTSWESVPFTIAAGYTNLAIGGSYTAGGYYISGRVKVDVFRDIYADYHNMMQ